MVEQPEQRLGEHGEDPVIHGQSQPGRDFIEHVLFFGAGEEARFKHVLLSGRHRHLVGCHRQRIAVRGLTVDQPGGVLGRLIGFGNPCAQEIMLHHAGPAAGNHVAILFVAEVVELQLLKLFLGAVDSRTVEADGLGVGEHHAIGTRTAGALQTQVATAFPRGVALVAYFKAMFHNVGATPEHPGLNHFQAVFIAPGQRHLDGLGTAGELVELPVVFVCGGVVGRPAIGIDQAGLGDMELRHLLAEQLVRLIGLLDADRVLLEFEAGQRPAGRVDLGDDQIRLNLDTLAGTRLLRRGQAVASGRVLTLPLLRLRTVAKFRQIRQLGICLGIAEASGRSSPGRSSTARGTGLANSLCHST